MNFLFLLLEAHSNMGGIQRFNRNVLNLLDQMQVGDAVAYALKDTKCNTNYSHLKYNFENNNKIIYVLKSFLYILRSDSIILGHVNLIFPIGILLFFFPKKRSILFTHGIEVWNTLPWYKRKILQQINTIVSVSDFTAQALIKLQKVNPQNIKILPNTISLEFMQSNGLSYLKERYHIHEEDFVLLTICRIDHSEKYKGYDSIIQLMPKLVEKHANIKYVLCGKTDIQEKKRLDELIHQSGCSNHIILTGFIPDRELSEMYSICNLFIMPSQKEGFGIVFLEALAHGKPVIGGNKDGTVDALMNGELGILVDPDSLDEIYEAILSVVERRVDSHLLDESYLKQKVFSNFGIEKFNERLKNIIFQN